MNSNRSLDKTTNRSFDKTNNRLLPPKSSRNQRLDRPGDLKNIQLLSAYPDSKIKIINGLIMIPIPPEDARALGLRAPDTDNSSVKSNSALSKSSANVANSKTLRKKTDDEDKSKKEVKRNRNVDTKTPKKVLDLKQERKAQRAATLEKLSNLHAKLERGLKNISNKTKTRPKGRSDSVKDSNNTTSNPSPIPNPNATGFRGTGRSTISSKFRKNSSSQEDKQEKLRKESSSKSTKQLFSTTESWSSDSVDSELQELRETIERLRKQSAEAGLNNGPPANNGRRHTLGDSDSGTTGCTGNSNHQGASMARQLSADSVTSLNSLSSACSASSHHKKKGWLRSSFSKAFSRSRKNRHGSVSDAEDCKESAGGDLSAPNSPRLPSASKHDSPRGQGARSNGQKSPEVENPLTGSKSSSALYKKEDEDVVELKKQLREKDLVLTDIRLEALSSAHQLESLKDTVIKMRNEMLNLKQNNERLQRLVTSKSLTSSQSSLPSDPDRRFSMTEVASTVAALSNGDTSTTADQLEDLNVPEHPVVPSTTTTTGEPALEQDTDGKRINVAIYLGSEKNFNYNLVTGSTTDGNIGEPPHCTIASVCISNKTTWDSLDSTVRRCFKEYVSRVDPVTNLGLGVECVAAYHLGEASRCTTDSQHPELLPCGYLIGHVKTIYLVLSGYSWLAVDTLIPRSIVQRLISLLTEHRRVILCGPSGTGKSYLAGKLAHALVDADNDTKDATAVATFNVDHKSSKELRQYLAHIAERCDSNAADELPRVIILENLQHAASLGELFSGLLGTRHSSCPAIIGTMSQATCSTTNLQLHHNFRWVLCANHMEPVKGFLGRYLRRKLLEHELRECGGTRNAEMAAVVEWLPRVWLHLNKFLETHSSSDVTIGPRLFLSCPMEVTGSQVWFTDLWNYSVVPYLVEAVREGLTLYGRRVSGNGNGDSSWEDPAQFITSSYPWISTHAVHGGSDALLRLRPEDVGYDVVTSGHTSGVGASSVKSLGSTHSDTEGDPLLNMLMRLQEAANYSSPHSNDSDSVTSLDSSHTRHSEDLSSSTSSSRGVESAL
ncbi:Protein sickie [Eufriesea mexicana]|uniref:Protein sickie n=1 Tax=Eufriesea mexicana TaxID=516756 RepID=A0A310S989_9HYME|nr:Protein sickie [Eufriesea mexicana]